MPKTNDPNTADITNMHFIISKTFPKRFNILTVNKLLKRITIIDKVPGEMRKMHKWTK
jgi:hypothetical protein